MTSSFTALFVVAAFLATLCASELSADIVAAVPSVAGHGLSNTVVERGLVSRLTSPAAVVDDYEDFSENTMTSTFPGEKLAYITPWNREGFNVAQIFAGGTR